MKTNTSYTNPPTLREHEIQILDFITNGYKFIHIATYYGLPLKAVRSYIKIILKKLQVKSVRDAVEILSTQSIFQ